MGDGVSIAILTPSRERPAQLLDMLDAIADTADTPIHVYVGIDEDDASGYEPNLDWTHDGNVHVWQTRGPRAQLAEWTNRLAVMALADGHEILGSFGDDHRPRTDGWDTLVAEAMATTPGLVYCADGLQNEKLPTAPFWSADIVRALGFFFPVVLSHMFADNAWLAIGRALNRTTYLPDVLIEHLHYSATGAEPDAINVANDAHYMDDMHAYHDWLKSADYQRAIERARAVL